MPRMTRKVLKRILPIFLSLAGTVVGCFKINLAFICNTISYAKGFLTIIQKASLFCLAVFIRLKDRNVEIVLQNNEICRLTGELIIKLHEEQNIEFRIQNIEAGDQRPKA